MKEISELQELYFLGKKKWHQLLLGKGTEMVIGGVISDTLSKHIIEYASEELSHIVHRLQSNL